MSRSFPAASAHRTKRKSAVIILGLLIMGYGVAEIATPMRLLFTGRGTSAELVRVVLERPGRPDQVISSAVDLAAATQVKDRAWTYWCEFRFIAAGGRRVEVRLPVGGKLKPAQPFTEADGSPRTLSVRYDRDHPEQVLFPTVFGVWFIPVIVLYIGFIGVLSGVILLRKDPDPAPGTPASP